MPPSIGAAVVQCFASVAVGWMGAIYPAAFATGNRNLCLWEELKAAGPPPEDRRITTMW
jgi:hypothetical protein